MHDDTIKRIWDILYRMFEGDISANALATLATQGAKHELQFRLMRRVAALRNASHANYDECIELIQGDILAANAAGWMTDQACAEITDLLADLSQNRP